MSDPGLSETLQKTIDDKQKLISEHEEIYRKFVSERKDKKKK